MARLPTLARVASDYGPSIYYDSSVRNMLEMHLPYLLSDAKITHKAIPPETAYKNDKDFFGLMFDLGYQQHYHWIIMRVNGLRSPDEYHEEILDLLIPSTDTIAKLINMHQTLYRIG